MNGQNNSQIIAIDEHRHALSTEHFPQQIDMSRGRASDEHDDEIDLKVLLSVLARRKKMIIAIVTLAVIIAFFYTMSVIPMYRATATVKIDLEADKLANFDNAFEEKNSYVRDRNFHQTQIDLLKSRALAHRVMDKMEFVHTADVQKEQPAFNKTLVFFRNGMQSIIATIMPETDEVGVKLGAQPVEMQFLKSLEVLPGKSSNVVMLHFLSPDPEIAATSVNTLAEEFIKMNLEGMSESSAYAKAYLTEQIALTKQKLEESESKLVKYAKEKQIINTDSKKSLVSDSLEVLNLAYSEAQKDLINAESEYRQRAKVSGDIRLLENAVIQGLKSQRNTLQAQYKKDLQTYKPAFPAMVALKKQINDVQRQINIEINNINKKSKDDLQVQFFSAREKEQMLSKKLELKKAELLSQRDKNIGYTTLEREVETNRQLYDNLLQRMKEVGIAGGVVSNNISIVDKAFVPYQKYTPNSLRNMLMGALLGLLIGIALAFAREKLDGRIRTIEDLENLGQYPVLGIFPFIKAKSKQEGAVLLEEQYELESEAFHSLVNNLRYLDKTGIPKILHISSASPSEGKSNTVINMAMIIAQSNKKVLLIDADLRKPRIHKYLDVKAQLGLSDFLIERAEFDEVVTLTKYENLSLVTAGSSMPNPAKLLADERLMELLENASNEFDHVIIDSPPVLGLADALILSNRSNATIFAVASNQTKKAHLENALKRLRLGYGNVVGFVLTKSKSTKKDYYSYENYYGYRDQEVATQLEYKKTQ
ncbi:MAG: Capsular exopolysaccharide family [uncultured Thiotrichaceae bacterium]|uniref:non-specific protein-tyrosine kinase n=1 Tax=uncultured Thiotrichaceae bacterium TaxID=298394 RepID=A0A6S6U9M5_9GAMM|nr:MAG: Capsular exopolysaccharide family [uncultured Thiotrichaceae bacterium]